MMIRRPKRSLGSGLSPAGAAWVALVLFGVSCNRAAPTITCQSVRQLRFGMKQGEVQEILGAPLGRGEICCPSWSTVPRDVTWAYHRNVFALGRTSLEIPSTIRVFVDFKGDRMVLATVSKRFPYFGNEHTLFVVDKNGVHENQSFREAFCK
jgi:hypothetical protein